MHTTWTFHSVGSLIFDRHAVRQLGEVAGRLPARRVFVVTDSTLVRIGAAAQVSDALTAAGVEIGVFDGGEAEPSLRLVERCAAVARQFGPDAVLGLGGGSNMDVAKFVAVLL